MPLLHGEAGLLDELLLFGAPLIVVIIILVMASRRSHKNAKPRERLPQEASTEQSQSPDDAQQS